MHAGKPVSMLIMLVLKLNSMSYESDSEALNDRVLGTGKIQINDNKPQQNIII